MAIKKVIISGGGTGGHIFPALAIAKELKRRDAQCEILFVGAEGKMEMEKVPEAGFPIKSLPIAGMQRKLSFKNLLLPFKVLRSLIKARKIILDFRPDLAIGVGGYASAPTLYVASVLGTPTYLQEQNAYPGLTNKILGRKAIRIFGAHEKLSNFFPKSKITLTGNPIRPEVLRQVSRQEARQQIGLGDKKTILFVGGSLGARVINQFLIANYDQLLERGYQIIWQCGKSYWEAHPEIHQLNKTGLVLSAFLSDMALYYAAADVVVSRAGALAISELSALAKATVFVPSPYVAEDHQTKNAMALVEQGACVLVKEEEVNSRLTPTLIQILDSEGEIKRYENAISKLGKRNAAKELVDVLMEDFA